MAREAVRQIMTEHNFEVIMSNNKKVDKLLKSYPFLSNINDHRILCEAELYGREHGTTIMFLTSDALQYLFACELPHLEAIYPMGTELVHKVEEGWPGWGKYFPNEKEMALLYADPKINILGCKINEFAEIYEDTNLKDVLFWNGNEYTKLKYKDIKNPYIGETVRPRNIEQKMAMHLLQNQDIKVKLLTSAWGGGKTLLALSYALE